MAGPRMRLSGPVLGAAAVEDLEQGVAHAVGPGARVTEHQPQSGVRVMLEHEGHPFCPFPGAV
jgi:hypothetical protein